MTDGQFPSWPLSDLSVDEKVSLIDTAPATARQIGIASVPLSREGFISGYPCMDIPQDLYCVHIERITFSLSGLDYDGPMMLVIDPSNQDKKTFSLLSWIAEHSTGEFISGDMAIAEIAARCGDPN